MLATIVWAASASAFAGYYYLQNRNHAEQLDDTYNSLNKLASNYDEAVNKYDLLLSEYYALYGNYLYFTDSNYISLMEPLENLIVNLGKNYTSLFAQEDLNKTYTQLLGRYETLAPKDNMTRAEFGNLLTECHELFSLSALRELGLSISEATTLSVSICIHYGNGTVEWHNGTQVSAGCTLFELTQKIATITSTYYASIEPGHILIDSVNDKAAYVDPSFTWGNSWKWYYLSESQKSWTFGPVGCDAWLLKSGGIYKWSYEYWSFP
jgi:hypothetical protein